MRLIDGDKLFQTIAEHDYPLSDWLHSTDRGMFTKGIKQAIDEQPMVDAVPVIHATWEDHLTKRSGKHDYYQCSACGCASNDLKAYCPRCGAKMDGIK